MTEQCGKKFVVSDWDEGMNKRVLRECICERIPGHQYGSCATKDHYASGDHARTYDDQERRFAEEARIRETELKTSVRIATALEELVRQNKNKQVF